MRKKMRNEKNDTFEDINILHDASTDLSLS